MDNLKDEALAVSCAKIEYLSDEIKELRRCLGLCMMRIDDRELLKQCDNAMKHEMCRSVKIHD